jgi:hypothetical protein
MFSIRLIPVLTYVYPLINVLTYLVPHCTQVTRVEQFLDHIPCAVRTKDRHGRLVA